MATKFYDFTQKTDFTLSIEIPTIDTKIEVIDGDCLDQALRLKSLGLNPVVLNMASHRRPGGGTIFDFLLLTKITLTTFFDEQRIHDWCWRTGRKSV